MTATSPRDGTMSVHPLRALVLAALERGVAPAALERDAALPPGSLAPEVLADGDGRVPARVVARLWEHVPALCRDEPAFGIWLATRAADAGLTAAWWIVQSSPTWRDGLERAIRYQRLLHDHNRSRLVAEPGGVRYEHRIGDAAFRGPRHAVEFGMALLVLLARRSTGAQVKPRRVTFQHAAPADLREHRALFGAHVAFEAESDSMSFDDRALALPHQTANPALREILERHAAALLDRVPDAGASTTERVRGMLATSFGELDDIARRLGVPRRTLQRRLRSEGTTFVALVDAVRRDLAQRYLADRALGLDETALLLGFSEQSAFHRAFVRWTGETPGAFRRKRLG